jgi:hypothetical protein
MPIFGDTSSFAIRCDPDPLVIGRRSFAICHLILSGEEIGDPDDTDMVGVSASHLEMLEERILGKYGSLEQELFSSYTDLEILELIFKSNQLEEEFDDKYSYLPVLESEGLWGKHTFYLGESLDAYFMVMVKQDGLLKFIWRNCRLDEVAVRSASCAEEQVLKAINSARVFLAEQYLT